MGDRTVETQTTEVVLLNPEIQVKGFDQLTPYQVAHLYALRYYSQTIIM